MFNSIIKLAKVVPCILHTQIKANILFLNLCVAFFFFHSVLKCILVKLYKIGNERKSSEAHMRTI